MPGRSSTLTPQERRDAPPQPFRGARRSFHSDSWKSPFDVRSKDSAFLKPLKFLAGLALFSTEDLGPKRKTQISVKAWQGHVRGSQTEAKPDVKWQARLVLSSVTHQAVTDTTITTFTTILKVHSQELLAQGKGQLLKTMTRSGLSQMHAINPNTNYCK